MTDSPSSNRCAYCDHPADRQGAIFHGPGCAGLTTINMSRLEYDALVARATSEPPAPHSGDHLQRFTSWLVKEMPAGTVIGDPIWWARRLLAAACVTADELPEPPSAARFDTSAIYSAIDGKLRDEGLSDECLTDDIHAAVTRVLDPSLPPPSRPSRSARLEERISTALSHLEIEIPDVRQAKAVLLSALTKTATECTCTNPHFVSTSCKACNPVETSARMPTECIHGASIIDGGQCLQCAAMLR